MGDFSVTVTLREPEYDALQALIPGYGDSVAEVIQFILTDWMQHTLGLDWMKEHALIKGWLREHFEPQQQTGGRPK